MNRFCLIGHPLGHSLSPQIQARLFKLGGQVGSYTLRDAPPETLAGLFAPGAPDGLRRYDGFNVTIPYKQAVIPYLDSLSPRAALYGAVNTVRCSGGRLEGHNTDGEGFLRALAGAGIALRGRVLLCGAGGVSHTMACEALSHGCALTVAARSAEKAGAFAAFLQQKIPGAAVSSRPLCEAGEGWDLILNGTPSGMYPSLMKEMPVPAETARSAAAVFDAVYNPRETLLLRTAKAAGAKTLDGLSMLVWQAAAAQEIWLGARFTAGQIGALCRETADLLRPEAAE